MLIAAFLAGAIALDRGLAGMAGHALSRTYQGEGVGQINAALRRVDVDILIFGNSRAKHHVDPTVLEQFSGQRAFNVGCNGQGIYYHYLLESLILSRGTAAKTFLLEVDPVMLYSPHKERALRFAPFADQAPQVESFLKSIPKYRVKRLSKLWPYNSLLLSLVKNYGQDGPSGSGFSPLPDADTRGAPTDWKTFAAPVVDEDALRHHRYFISQAQDRGIDVVLFASPRLDRDREYEQSGKLALSKLARESEVRLLWFDGVHYEQLADATLYHDNAHLSGAGATILSQLVAQSIGDNPHKIASGTEDAPAR